VVSEAGAVDRAEGGPTGTEGGVELTGRLGGTGGLGHPVGDAGALQGAEQEGPGMGPRHDRHGRQVPGVGEREVHEADPAGQARDHRLAQRLPVVRGGHALGLQHVGEQRAVVVPAATEGAVPGQDAGAGRCGGLAREVATGGGVPLTGAGHPGSDGGLQMLVAGHWNSFGGRGP
jgi:hypothetical protein